MQDAAVDAVGGALDQVSLGKRDRRRVAFHAGQQRRRCSRRVESATDENNDDDDNDDDDANAQLSRSPGAPHKSVTFSVSRRRPRPGINTTSAGDSSSSSSSSHVEPPIQDWSPRALAAAAEEDELSRLLLHDDVEASFGALELSPLMLAARAGDTEAVESLLARGADPLRSDCRGFDALMYAVRDGHADAARLLLGAMRRRLARTGATGYTFHNPHGLSHMLYAALNGHTACVDVLRRAGGRVDVADAQGCTPLMAAAGNNHADTVRKLVELGAACDKRDRSGMTALAWAAKEGAVDGARALLAMGADVDLADTRKRSPLFWAVAAEKAEMGQLLLGGGARVSDAVRLAVMHAHLTAKKRAEDLVNVN